MLQAAPQAEPDGPASNRCVSSGFLVKQALPNASLGETQKNWEQKGTGATEGFRKKWKCEKLSSVTKQPMQQQFWGFRRAHGTGYIGLAATTWVPMDAQVPVLSPNDHPNQS